MRVRVATLRDQIFARARARARACCSVDRSVRLSGVRIFEVLLYQKFLSWNWSDLLQLNGSTSKKTPRCSDEARRAATLRLVRCGELSRASRLLTSKGLAPASEDTTAKLASKHPSRATGLHLPSLSQDSIKLSSSALFDAIRRAPRGSGAGLSGWRFEHLKVLLENELTADCLFSACSAIARGILPAAAVTLFSSSRLIALPKSNGDIRPIAVGEAIRRLTARAICQQKKELFSSFFCPSSMVWQPSVALS